MGWFGPRDECGCCGTPPPPPPPPPICWCDENDCLPAGKRQFSSVRAVVDLDDSYKITELREDYICGADPCANEYYERLVEGEIAGMSAANGTYDGIYLVEVSFSEYVEADPAEEQCGWWFFPYLELTLTNYITDSRTYPSGCRPNQITNLIGPPSVYFDPYNGKFIRKSTDLIEIPLFSPTLQPYQDTATIDHHWVDYNCKGESTESLQLAWAPQGSLGTGQRRFPSFPFINAYSPNLLEPPLAGPVGIAPSTGMSAGRQIIFDGQLGIAIYWGKGVDSPSCQIYWESVENTLAGFYSEITGPAACAGGTANRTLTWNSFRRKHSIILNA